MNKKETGSYYTPDYLAEFITQRVFSKLKGKTTISVLEPSVGDGVFIRAIKTIYKRNNIRIEGLDIEKDELKKVRKIWRKKDSSFRKKDFLTFSLRNKFSLVIGNPPYIKRNLLTEFQKKECKKVHLLNGLSDTSIKNIWTSFLIKSTNLLEDDGILAFVLPLELLQVKFTEEIRTYLKDRFQRLEIFTFDDLLFDCKGQDTIVLFAYKQAKKKGVFFANIKDKSELLTSTFELKKNEILGLSNTKWTHHILSSDELSFIFKIKENLKRVSEFCNSKPGIVTAANSFFIVNQETEKKYKLEKFTVPIVQKGLFINGSIVFDEKDYQELNSSNLPSKFLRIQDKDVDSLSSDVLNYLKTGKQLKIHERYKCKMRDNWFVVPNVSYQPEGFFLKRGHFYPKILKNSANVFVTDSAYKIEMKNGYDIESFIYSFYNSLTLTLAELEGRYYGGGVLELVPSEFKNLALPYLKISKKEFSNYRKQFEKKKNIEIILDKFDYQILNTSLKLSKREIQKISKIRQKLLRKRFRKK